MDLSPINSELFKGVSEYEKVVLIHYMGDEVQYLLYEPVVLKDSLLGKLSVTPIYHDPKTMLLKKSELPTDLDPESVIHVYFPKGDHNFEKNTEYGFAYEDMYEVKVHILDKERRTNQIGLSVLGIVFGVVVLVTILSFSVPGVNIGL